METKIEKLTVAPLKDMSSYEDKPNGQLVMENANGKVFVVAIKKGQSLPRHFAPEDALVLCLEGAVKFHFDKDEADLSAGDYFVMEKGTAHSVTAPEDTKVMLTIVRK